MKHQTATLTTRNHQSSPVLQSVKAHGRLEGLIHTMTLSQVFRNTTKDTLEVIYTFPLSWGAVLLDMNVSLNGQRKRGVVMPRQEASERYETAVQSGDAPVMVEIIHDGLYSSSVGSLKPDETLTIELTYAQLLRYEQGRIRLTLPTTLAPRFGDATRQSGLRPEQTPDSSLLVEYPFSLQMDIAGELARADIFSPSHSLQRERTDDGISLRITGNAWLDRDFVLLLGNLQGQSLAVCGPDLRSGPGHIATLASFHPGLTGHETRPMNVKILVDCSGSMQGDSMKQARRALSGLNTLLEPFDRFSLTRFGSRIEREIQPSEATESGRERLMAKLKNMQADLGGTELKAALENTFELEFPQDSAKESDILLITDGDVWDAQAIVNRARASGHRIYALGVGSAPAESLLQELAEATGGACEMVTPNENMVQAITRLMARMHETLQVESHLIVSEDVLWCSPAPQRLASDETVHLFIRTSGALTQTPALQINGTRFAADHIQPTTSDVIARLLAHQQIALTANRQEATTLAETYQLVTQYTNLLLVVERAESDKTDGMPELHQVTHMTPAGWGGTGTARGITPRACASTSALDSLPHSFSLPVFLRRGETMSDDFELPAFLRRQPDPTTPPASDAPKESTTPLIQTDPSEKLDEDLDDLMVYFNELIDQGYGFRHALGMLMAHPIAKVWQAGLDALQALGQRPVDAWAYLLLWANRHTDSWTKLSEKSLKCVMDQLGNVSDEEIEQTFKVIEGSILSDGS